MIIFSRGAKDGSRVWGRGNPLLGEGEPTPGGGGTHSEGDRGLTT